MTGTGSTGSTGTPASAPAASAPAASARYARATGKRVGEPGWKNGLPCDAVTGAPLDPAHARIVRQPDRDRMPVRRRRYLEADGEPIAPPVAMHQHPYHGGTLAVGLSYSSLMNQYIGAIDDMRVSAEAREDAMWWISSYGVARVLKGLRLRNPEVAAQHILRVMLEMHRERIDPQAIAERHEHSLRWVLEKVAWTFRLANGHRESCACATCQRTRLARLRHLAAAKAPGGG